MAFNDGDFLEIEYSVWTTLDNALIATTDSNRAKEGNIYDERTRYGPVLVVLGSNSVVKGLDRELHTVSLNEVKSVIFKPADAFGERLPDLTRIMPLSDFRKRDIDPYPGMEVNVDNATAIVKSVNSGRVVVDLNHRYAGQEIKYEIKVVKHITSEIDKVKSLGRTYNVEPSEVNPKGEDIGIKFDNNVKKNTDYFIGRANMIAAIFTYLEGINKVEIIEEYLKPKEKKESKDRQEYSA